MTSSQQKTISHLKVALVTDWLTNIGGGEKVLKAVADIFPDAPIYTTVVNKTNIGDLAKRDIHTSFLQKIPFIHKKHQILLPWLPRAIESLDLSEYNLILSFSSSVAKSVITHSDQIHICYIHSPMRYAWEPFFDMRFKRIPNILKPFVNTLLHRLRLFDKATSTRPDFYISNSLTTKARVKKYYRLDSDVLYPPVDINKFHVDYKKEEYYLGLGRFVEYKKFDLLIKTFKKLPDKKLIIVGDGPERKYLQNLAENASNIEFFGKISDNKISGIYSKAKAFILPQKEDAGIVQLEALASGTPVIAFKSGGALDVIKENENGVFFNEQTPESLIEAINKFEGKKWEAKNIIKTVKKYSVKSFQEQYLNIITTYYNNLF